MCSVVGCDSWRRKTQRFKLPEDPERRLEWVQFLFAVNKQRFKESSWTDITICSEHFKDDCFDRLTPVHSGLTGTVQLTLHPSAVPSLFLKSEEPGTHLDSPECVEPEETAEFACQRDQLKTCDGLTSFSEESRSASMAARGSPVPRGVPWSAHTSDAFISVSGQPNNMNFDLMREKATLLQMKGKYVVNEQSILQLFHCKCPSCGCKLQMEKVTCGMLLILNQQCLQCEYRNQWKSQVNASVPAAEDQQLTEVEVEIDVTPETQQAVPGVPEIVAVIDEESDPMDESSDQEDMDSDEDWKPVDSFYAGVLKKIPDDDDDEEDDDDDDPSLPPKHSQLCADCGMFFNNQKPHTCEHKIKPFSCNICGKRCVSENALNTHSRIHDENYEFGCKFCQVTFKTKVDKITHEQIHLTQGKPYKCPDCSLTFATSKQRKIHLEDHRGPQQLKCHICGIEFLWPLSLQRHLAVHTGEKPFKCSVCQRGFKQAGHLKSHMRLHTGERPFQCQHCDKSFNHNVSLKSHVQRYHSSSSGREGKKENMNEWASDSGDAQRNGRIAEEHDTEVQKERIYRPKMKRKSTGRPIGRPKSYEPGSLVEGQRSDTNTGKSERTQCSDEECEDEASGSDTAFDSAEGEEESCKKETKNTARSRGRTKKCDNKPAERKKKRYGSGRRRGRPRKNVKAVKSVKAKE